MADAGAGAAGSSEPQLPDIPITILSGFLGAGKTTMLREVLQNKGGVKVAVVVNDVAKINIDSKLVRERTSGSADGDLAECLELQNGCACCNASDELLAGILQLLRVSQRRGFTYDRIIIELSGVSEPKNVRREFAESAEAGHIALKQAKLQTMITVVDSPSFTSLYQSKEEIMARSDLYMEDLSMAEDADSDRKVVDLLVEQVECADYIVLNKTDQCVGDQVETLKGIVSAINPNAEILSCAWGKVPLETVLGPPKGSSWVCNADDEDDLRAAVQASKELHKKRKLDEGHGHAHGHAHGHEDTKTADGHAHGHGDGATGHAHGHTDAKDGGHAHEHSHDSHHGHGDEKSGTGHAHDHSHESRQKEATTAEKKYGITSFVYSRRRPFHPQRLMQVIMYLPVKVDPSTGNVVDKWEFPSEGKHTEVVENEGAPMRAIIRSKGFVWVANQHRTAQYWSHAGHYFELRALGLWWAATPLDNWPDAGDSNSSEVTKIAVDFAPPSDPSADMGDRRQEIVFIGVGMKQDQIEALMDRCLLTDEEMAVYREKAKEAAADAVKIDSASFKPVKV